MLKGTLEDFALSEVLRLLSAAKKTGRLDITRRAGTGFIFFRSGEVVYAETELSSSLLGQKLVRTGAITELQLRRALDEQASGGDRLGRILLASGAVDEIGLENSLRGQIEDAAFELLSWETGEFSWTDGDPDPIEVELALSVEDLVLEVSRRLQDRDLVLRKITSPDVVCRLATHPPDGAERINITSEEWRVLVLVDGRRSAAEIAETVGAVEFDTMRTLYGLASAGLIEADRDARPEDVPPLPGPAEPKRPEPAQPAPKKSHRPQVEVPGGPSDREAAFPSAAEEWFADPDLSPPPQPERPQPVAPRTADLPPANLPPVDRAAAVRELSGIVDDPRPPKTPPPPPGPRPQDPREPDDPDKKLRSRQGRTSRPD